MRKCHFLKRNHSSQSIQNCIFFDTETKQEQIDPVTKAHHLWFGWAAYVQRKKGGKWGEPQWFRFESRTDFWEWVDSKVTSKTRLNLFCHNTSFDLPVMDCFRFLPQMGYKLKMAVIDAPPTILKFRNDRGTIMVYDTLNWWRMSLKQLGKSIGLDKEEMPNEDKTQKEWDEYCRRDVEVIMKAVCEWADFLKNNDYGGFAPTLASQAFRTYRHRFMQSQIAIHDNERACKLERQAYMGGRNECFRIGHLKGSWVLLDVNSMYPYVMQKYLYPTKLIYHSVKKSVDDIKELLKKYCLICKVTVITDEPAYAVKLRHRLIFPIGKFTCYLTTTELMYALKHDHIVDVHETAVYHKGILFRKFVKEFYAMRLASKERGNLTDSLKYKILLNSLYGKFGQRGLIYEELDTTNDLSAKTWEEYNVDTGKVYKYRQLGGIVQRQSIESESRDSFPAIAAHVTANARHYLWQLIKIAGTENVSYCDTDSILVSSSAVDVYRPIIHPTKLGYLDKEGEYNTVTLWAAKDYIMGNKVKHKGIKANATEIRPGSYRQDQWSSLKGLLRSGRLDTPTTKSITKTLHREYKKGAKTATGEVTPYLFCLPPENVTSTP